MILRIHIFNTKDGLREKNAVKIQKDDCFYRKK